MKEKAKWALIYLSACSLPLLSFLLRPETKLVHAGNLSDFLRLSPYVGLALVAFLGWQVNQTRIFWSAVLFLALYHLLLPGVLNPTFLQVLAVAFPLFLAVTYGLRESRLWSDASLARVLLALFPLVLFACLEAWAPDILQGVLFWGPPAPGENRIIPPMAWVACLPLLGVLAWGKDAKIKPFLMAQTAVLVPFFHSLYANLALHPEPFRSTTLPFGTATLVLLFALIRMYLQKVYLDPLTAVYNRQALDERLHTLSGPFSLAMVDIDHFKRFNDTYGHAEGDNVLRMVAQHLQEKLGDRVYRYGGEEFCVIFEKGDPEAYAQMEKARASIASRKFTLRGKRTGTHSRLKNPFKKSETRGKKVGITISVGVAASGGKDRGYEEVIKKADQALYQAKEKGRDQVVSADK